MKKPKGLRKIRYMTVFVVLVLILAQPFSCLSAAIAPEPINGYTVDMTADPCTYTVSKNSAGTLSKFASASEDGKVWTDKSVSDGAFFGSGGEALIPAPENGNFNVMLSALAQQYITTTSTATSAVAADVVLILDVTYSMELNSIPKDRNRPNKDMITRTEAMVEAANKAIKVIMNANPQNRVAVTTFTALPASKGSVKWTNASTTLMPLSAYAVADSYLTYSTEKISTANGVLSPGNVVAVDGGTNAQDGIQFGANVLCTDIAKQDFAAGGTRQPFVLLLTDGATSAASNDWNGDQAALANKTNREVYKEDVPKLTALTILTAMYQKSLIDTAYTKYNNGKPTHANFFNIGLGIDESKVSSSPSDALAQALLKPSCVANATDSSVNIKAVDVKNELIKAANAKPGFESYSTDFVYADKYCYFATAADELQVAFDALASEVKVATSAVASPVSSTANGGQAVVFTDTLDQSVEMKSAPIVQYNGANYMAQAPSVTGSTSTYTYSELPLLSITYDSSAKTVIWNIPDNLLPLYKFKDEKNAALGYNSALPIRAVYQVGLTQAVQDGNKALGSPYYLNAFSNSAKPSYAKFIPTIDNPFYYHVDKGIPTTVGKVLTSGTITASASNPYYTGAVITSSVHDGTPLTNVYVTSAMTAAAPATYSADQIGTLLPSCSKTPAMNGSMSDCSLAKSGSVTPTAAQGAAFASKQASYDTAASTRNKSANTTGTSAAYYSPMFTGGLMTVALGNNGKFVLSAQNQITLGVDKEAVPQGVETDITYRIPVSNNSGVTIKSAVITDTLPAGLTFVGTDHGGTDSGGGVLTWNLNDFAANSSVVLTVNAKVPSTATLGTVFTNSAVLTADGTRTVSNSVTTRVSAPNQPTITASVDKLSALPGDPLNYTMYVMNPTGTEFKNVTVDSTLPSGLTSSDSDKSTIPHIGPYRVEEVKFAASIPSGLTQNQTYSRAASITAIDGKSQSSINSNTVTTAVSAFGSLTLSTVWDDFDNAAGLRPTTTDLTLAAKSGSTDITSSVLTGANPSKVVSNGSVTWSNLPLYHSGSPVSYYIKQADVTEYSAPVYGGSSNSACLITFDSSGSAAATVTNSLRIQAPTIVKKATASALPGGKIDYTVTVSNPNAFELKNIAVCDILPKDLTADSSNMGGGTISSGTINWTLASVPANSSMDIAFSAIVPANLTSGAAYSNTASVISVNGNTSSGLTSTSNSADTSVAAITTPTITKTVDKVSILPGDKLTYTITVSNSNLTPLSDVLVTDTVPVGLVADTINNGGVNSAGIITWTIPSVPAKANGADGTASVSFTATVPADAADKCVYKNTAQIASVSKDTSKASISGEVTSTYNAPVAPTIQIIATPASGNVNPLPGEKITYTITVTNPNATPIKDVSVSDKVPDGLNVGTISNGGVNSSGVIAWTIASVAPSGSETVSFETTVPPALTAGATYDNAATVDSVGGDASLAAKSGNVKTVVVPLAKLSITKIADKTDVQIGDTVTYTITVTNSNSVPVYGIAVTDTLPAGLSAATIGNSGINTSGTITWQLASIAANSSTVLSFTATVSASPQSSVVTISNLAELSVNGDASMTVVSQPADITLPAVIPPSVSMSVSRTVAFPGDILTYTITVSNPNPVPISDVQLQSNIPSGLAVKSVNNNGSNRSGSDVSWNIPAVSPVGSGTAVGSSAVTFSALVPSGLAGNASYAAAAAITSVNGDANIKSNTPPVVTIVNVPPPTLSGGAASTLPGVSSSVPNSSSSRFGSPQTGDNSYTALWIFTFLISLLTFIAAIIYLKRKKK
ncbi:MAG: isopeptide-forming domain-containing fimbrial protein [Oscillospiraceae bacterium]